MRSSDFFFETSHAFSEVTSVTRDRFVRNSGFEAQIIADLRPILRVPPGQRYRGASGGLSSPGSQPSLAQDTAPRRIHKSMGWERVED
jgi:hypothetical protein